MISKARNSKVNNRDGDKLKKLYFEPTSLCNLSCRMCFRKSWIDEHYGNMDFAVFKKAMDDPMVLANTDTVFFGGQGEPLIHPEIFSMISYAKNLGKRVELITNGTSINRDVCQKLIFLGLDTLWVSIDSFDPAGYEQIQVGSDFGAVVENILCYNSLRQGSPCELGLTFILMKSNILQLLEYEKFTDYIGADRVNISNMVPSSKEMESETLAYQTILHEYAFPHKYGGRKSDRVALVRFLDEDIADNPGVEKLIDEHGGILWKGEPLIRREENCRFIDEGTCFIKWDGNVSPCMELLHSSETYLYGEKRTVMHFSYGNLNDSTLSEIWNRDDYRSFRDRTDKFEYSPCTSCGGCLKRTSNKEDCIGSIEPVCGACLWGQGVAQCP